MAKRKTKTPPRTGHYFATTFENFKRGESLLPLLRDLTKIKPRLFDNEYLGIWYVPVPMDTPYRIESFQPMVEGAELIFLDRCYERDTFEGELFSPVAAVIGGKVISTAKESCDE